MQREQLADFLRRRREAVRPADVGLTEGLRRRTAGLRREEVAMLAGMSVDYVVRLEQGRSSQPSTQLLGALARALRLTDDERDHLFHLAGHHPPHAEAASRLARAGLVRMLDLLGDVPAAVLSDLGEVLAQNRMGVLLMGDQTGFTGDRRHLAYRWFTEPGQQGVHAPEERERHSRELVADLRATAGRRSGDPEVAAFVEEYVRARGELGEVPAGIADVGALRERMRAWTAYERTAMLVHVDSRAATRASHRQVLPVLQGTLAAELGLDG